MSLHYHHLPANLRSPELEAVQRTEQRTFEHHLVGQATHHPTLTHPNLRLEPNPNPNHLVLGQAAKVQSLLRREEAHARQLVVLEEEEAQARARQKAEAQYRADRTVQADQYATALEEAADREGQQRRRDAHSRIAEEARQQEGRHAAAASTKEANQRRNEAARQAASEVRKQRLESLTAVTLTLAP